MKIIFEGENNHMNQKRFRLYNKPNEFLLMDVSLQRRYQI